MLFRRNKNLNHITRSLDPDEIFLDARNLPSFNQQQFEGQIEKPIARATILILTITFMVVGLIYISRIGYLQINRGQAYAERSQYNSLRLTPIYANRGVIYDRTNTEIAWNDPDGKREYTPLEGLSHVLGYLGYPTVAEIASSTYEDPKSLVGKAGVETTFNSKLAGESGVLIEEVNAHGAVESNHIQQQPKNGDPLVLSIDSRIQNKMFEYIRSLSYEQGYTGGSGVIMDVNSGEVLSLTSFPEYSSTDLSSTSTARVKLPEYLADKRQPFLDRAVSGVYAPGSIFKPIMAVGALEEGVISPTKQILSTGSISIANPYNPKLKTVFKDWQPQGWVDMRHALAVSSDVYFYEIGGGYPGQAGIGIANIDKYSRLFGLSSTTGVELKGEAKGLIPTPEWKALNFPDDKSWRIGDTYHTSIGQYGVQVTPIQMARVAAAIANNGKLLKPTLVASSTNVIATNLPVKPANLQVVKEGMRLAVLEGTGKGLNITGLQVAAKTGTAELGASKANVNSWVIGFFPYEHPRYAFAVVMERGKVENHIGGVYIMRQLLDWMLVHTPEYLK
jgi:penicillin-binding protein 2